MDLQKIAQELCIIRGAHSFASLQVASEEQAEQQAGEAAKCAIYAQIFEHSPKAAKFMAGQAFDAQFDGFEGMEQAARAFWALHQQECSFEDYFGA